MKKAVGYIRVSTDLQDNSLDVQKERIIKFCEFHNIFLLELICDENVSGGKDIYDRKGGVKIKELVANKEIDCIVSIKIDRLFRSTINALTTVGQWNESGIGLNIIDVGGASSLDTSSAVGKMIFTFLVAQHQFEREIAGERTKSVLKHKKDNLKAYSPTPYGYTNIDGKLILNEQQQEAIKMMKLLKSQGLSLRDIIGQLNIFEYKPSGGGEWHPSTIAQILSNSIHQESSLSN